MRMTQTLLALALFASLPAYAVESYVGIGVTQAPSEDEFQPLGGNSVREETDPYQRLFGGVWLNENFAIEAAYHDFGSTRLGPFTDFGYELDADGWSLGVVYEYGDATWAPYTKIGWFTADIDGEITTIAGPVAVSESDSGLLLEAGARWTPNDTFSLRGGYEWFDFDGGTDGGLTIAAEITF